MKYFFSKCVVACASIYQKTTVRAFSFPTNHRAIKNNRIRFAKDRQLNLTLFVVYISHFKEKSLKNV